MVIDVATDVYLRKDFSVGLRTNNDSSTEEFDQRCYILHFWGHFVALFQEFMGFVL